MGVQGSLMHNDNITDVYASNALALMSKQQEWVSDASHRLSGWSRICIQKSDDSNSSHSTNDNNMYLMTYFCMPSTLLSILKVLFHLIFINHLWSKYDHPHFTYDKNCSGEWLTCPKSHSWFLVEDILVWLWSLCFNHYAALVLKIYT